ncbi:MAG: hypothetical protein F4X22_00045 [Gemmatimonadales bacterium]|nr:hypothetical protein [Candidatus Palauibacter denitrificans]
MSAVAVGVWATAAGCGYATDPGERPLEGSWIGAVPLIDGGVSEQVSPGTLEFRRIGTGVDR